MIEDDAGSLGGRGRDLAVRLVGACFVLMSVVTGLAGVLWIIDRVRSGARAPAVSDGLIQTLGPLVLPVVLSVSVTWISFRIGRGLRRGAPWARWAALVVLVPACLPPLVLFFEAIRGGIPAGAVLALLLLIPPASASLLLTAWGTDRLFQPKGAVLLLGEGKATPASRPAVGPILKVALVAFVLILTIALFVLT